MTRAKENLIVLIPAYEPPREFIEYARKVASLAHALIVVNDGSGEEYDGIFQEIAEIENVRYLTYGENHGKGYALKHAFRYAGENFPSEAVLVTADCDGQHSIKDIMRVYKAAYLHPGALTLGSRDFTEPNVPPRSRAGNTNMCAMFKAFYGLELYDTQTGLRGFAVGLAERFLKVSGDRFEFELGQLIYAKKNGIPIYETPIDTIYPDDPGEHVSHFRTIRDSLRVLGVMLGNLGYYLLSSVLSAVVDVGVFFVLSTFIFPAVSPLWNLLATVSARVISSVVNFAFNYKYVFGGAGKSAIVRYYVLWACQLSASYGLVSLFSHAFSFTGVALSAAKAVGDLCLALLSYQIQQYWVFRGRDPKSFYGPAISYARAAARVFSRSYRCNVLPYDEGTVYVCRHLNMHGPYTTLKWLKFHVHPMMLSCFLDRKEFYDQLTGYTFTARRGKKKKKYSLKAAIASVGIVAAARSIRAIPVYRGSIKVTKTFRLATDALLRGQPVIVYPDIDYADERGEDDIYDGFLYLGEIYRRKCGKSLRFVPIYIDDERRKLEEFDAETVDNFKEDAPRVREYLRRAINGEIGAAQ